MSTYLKQAIILISVVSLLFTQDCRSLDPIQFNGVNYCSSENKRVKEVEAVCHPNSGWCHDVMVYFSNSTHEKKTIGVCGTRRHSKVTWTPRERTDEVEVKYEYEYTYTKCVTVGDTWTWEPTRKACVLYK